MVGDTDWEPSSLVVCAAADVNDDDGAETTSSEVVVATDELGVIIGIDIDDGFFKGTADELGLTEEDVLEEEDSETVREVDGDSKDCDGVVASVFEVVATVVEVVVTVFEIRKLSFIKFNNNLAVTAFHSVLDKVDA